MGEELTCSMYLMVTSSLVVLVVMTLAFYMYRLYFLVPLLGGAVRLVLATEL